MNFSEGLLSSRGVKNYINLIFCCWAMSVVYFCISSLWREVFSKTIALFPIVVVSFVFFVASRLVVYVYSSCFSLLIRYLFVIWFLILFCFLQRIGVPVDGLFMGLGCLVLGMVALMFWLGRYRVKNYARMFVCCFSVFNVSCNSCRYLFFCFGVCFSFSVFENQKAAFLPFSIERVCLWLLCIGLTAVSLLALYVVKKVRLNSYIIDYFEFIRCYLIELIENLVALFLRWSRLLRLGFDNYSLFRIFCLFWVCCFCCALISNKKEFVLCPSLYDLYQWSCCIGIAVGLFVCYYFVLSIYKDHKIFYYFELLLNSVVKIKPIFVAWVFCLFIILKSHRELITVFWTLSYVCLFVCLFVGIVFCRRNLYKLIEFFISLRDSSRRNNFRVSKQLFGGIALILSLVLYHGYGIKYPGLSVYPRASTRLPEKFPNYITVKNNPLPEDCSASISSKRQKIGFSCEAVYFKAIEDSLIYGQKIPQANIYDPVIKNIEQPFEYSVGMRTSLDVPIFYDEWKVKGSWMTFISHPKEVYSSDSRYGILANFVVPIIGANGNSLVKEVNGKWDLILNSAEIDLQKVINFHKSFELSFLAGVQLGWIKQKVEVSYSDFQIVSSSDDTPQKALGENRFLGLGPSVGFHGKFQFPHNIGLFVGAKYASILGDFRLSTVYSSLLNSPPDSTITVQQSIQRIVPYGQIQAALSKIWALRGTTYLEMMVGWEQQIWWDQMRMNWFSNLISQPDGSDLTLSGFFLRSTVDF